MKDESYLCSLPNFGGVVMQIFFNYEQVLPAWYTLYYSTRINIPPYQIVAASNGVLHR
jgi:hypothetical protein